MTDRILFSIIGILLASIFGLGVYSVATHPTESAALVPKAVSTVTSALTGGGEEDDWDREQEEGAVSVTPPAGTTQTPQTSTTGSTSGTPAAGTYTMAQVAQHASASSCYTAIDGSVYDLTSFIGQHPGGPVILQLCGTDGTAAFTAQHGGQRRPANELASLKIGILAQ